MSREFGPKRLLRARDAAKVLQVCERWVWHRIKDGSIPVIRLGGTTRIAPSDLEQFIQSGKKTN